MALITCPECKKQVSDKAAACPSCGAPIRPVTDKPARVERTGARWEGWGTAMILVGVVSSCAGASNASGTAMSIGSLLLIVGFVVFIVGRFK